MTTESFNDFLLNKQKLCIYHCLQNVFRKISLANWMDWWHNPKWEVQFKIQKVGTLLEINSSRKYLHSKRCTRRTVQAQFTSSSSLPKKATSTILPLIVNMDWERRSKLAEAELRNTPVFQSTTTKSNGMEEKPKAYRLVCLQSLKAKCLFSTNLYQLQILVLQWMKA